MESISKRVSPVINLSSESPNLTNFAYYSKCLNWLLRLYGVNFNESDSHRPVRFLYRFIMLSFFASQLTNVYFNVSIIYAAMMMGEDELIYIIIPALMAILRPLASIVGLVLNKRHLSRTFGQIVNTLTLTYNMSVPDIRKHIRRLEVFTVAVVLMVFLSGLATRCVLSVVIQPDLMYEKLVNITHQNMPQYVMYIGDTLLTFGTLLELISAVYFAVFCVLLTAMFSQHHFDVAGMKSEVEAALTVVRNRLTVNCQMVELVDKQFSTFLLCSFSFQVFTMCFWSRSITLDYPWIDLKYHLWIVHFIAVTSLSFGVQCWAAVILNQKVYSSVRYVIKQLYFNPEIKSEMNDYFILLSLLTSPPQITAWNSFAVTKGFVLTVCGTVLTYTVALYGMG